MIRELFKEQQRLLNSFFSAFDTAAMEQLLEQVLENPKMLFFCGVGKSGIIAKKIALTLMSTGTRALYLSPTSALHGDLGIVHKGDIFVFLSRSGESDELLALLPALRNKGVTTVAVVSKRESLLEKGCDQIIYLPLEKELCPFGLAPTTSTVLQLIFGEVFTVALMRKRGFTLEEYALNHPAGFIGRQLTLKVRDIMLGKERVPICSVTNQITEILVDLSKGRCGCLVVENQGVMEGIFTDGDLRRAMQQHGQKVMEMTVGDLMTKDPLTTSEETPAVEAMKSMELEGREITVLPVVRGEGRVVGLVKMHDIIQSGI